MKRINEYDILKVLTIILVVLSHTTYYKISSNYGGIDYQHFLVSENSIFLYKVFDKIRLVLYYFHMPLFMALSGALFYTQVQKNKWVSLADLMKNKFKRLMIPFFLFTIFYTLPIKYFSSYFKDIGIIKAVIGQLFLLGNSHLWYLYALFIIFFISFYVLKKNVNIYIFCIIYMIHLMSYLFNFIVISAPLEFLFWFIVGSLFELNRKIYNKYLDEIKYLFPLLLLLFLIFLWFNNSVGSELKLLKRFILDILAVLGSSTCYSIAYLLSKKTNILNSGGFKLILVNGLGIYIFSDSLNYLILKIIFESTGNFMFLPIGIVIMVILRFIVTLFLGLYLTIMFKKFFKEYSWLVN